MPVLVPFPLGLGCDLPTLTDRIEEVVGGRQRLGRPGQFLVVAPQALHAVLSFAQVREAKTLLDENPPGGVEIAQYQGRPDEGEPRPSRGPLRVRQLREVCHHLGMAAGASQSRKQFQPQGG